MARGSTHKNLPDNSNSLQDPTSEARTPVDDVRAHQLIVSCKVGLTGSQPYNHIIGFGGSDNGTEWHRTEAEALMLMDRGIEEYFVRDKGNLLRLVVGKFRYRNFTHVYLKGEHDKKIPKTIADLPECPNPPF